MFLSLLTTIRQRCQVCLLAALLAASFSPNGSGQGFRPVINPEPLPIKAVGKTASARSPARWQRFQIGEPSIFSITFPQEPQQFTRSTRGNDGSGSQWIFAAASETTVFTASLSEANNAERDKSENDRWRDFNNEAAGFIAGLRKNAAFEISGEPVSTVNNRIKSKSGIEGFEREVVFKQRHARMQSFSVGNRRLSISAIWPPGAPKSELEAYFNSLSVEMARGSAEEAVIAAPLAHWKRYELGNGLISVMLPCEPKEVERELNSPEGSKARITSYQCEVDDANYFLSYVELPEGQTYQPTAADVAGLYSYTWSLIDANLKKTIDDRLKTLNLKPIDLRVSETRKAMVGGVAGEEKTFAIGLIEARAQITFFRGRMLQMVGFWTIETPLATREAFLKSFKLKP